MPRALNDLLNDANRFLPILRDQDVAELRHTFFGLQLQLLGSHDRELRPENSPLNLLDRHRDRRIRGLRPNMLVNGIVAMNTRLQDGINSLHTDAQILLQNNPPPQQHDATDTMAAGRVFVNDILTDMAPHGPFTQRLQALVTRSAQITQRVQDYHQNDPATPQQLETLFETRRQITAVTNDQALLDRELEWAGRSHQIGEQYFRARSQTEEASTAHATLEHDIRDYRTRVEHIHEHPFAERDHESIDLADTVGLENQNLRQARPTLVRGLETTNQGFRQLEQRARTVAPSPSESRGESSTKKPRKIGH